MIKSKKTNKKFYNKWLYKISIRLEGAAAFRLYSLKDLNDVCISANTKRVPLYLSESLKNDPTAFVDLISFLSTFNQSVWTKRIERSCLDFYTNDKSFYDSMSEKFQDRVIHRFEPDQASINTLDDVGTILSKKLPHGKYQFRVYLKPHKMAKDPESKEKYLNWLKSQVPRITISAAIENWFQKTDWNWDRRYILVEDEKTLLMLKLRNSEVIGKIYNYRVFDK